MNFHAALFERKNSTIYLCCVVHIIFLGMFSQICRGSFFPVKVSKGLSNGACYELVCVPESFDSYTMKVTVSGVMEEANTRTCFVMQV